MIAEDAASVAATAKSLVNNTPPDSLTKGGLVENALKADSLRSSVTDSLKNMNLSDLKGVVTGENTILKDALRSLAELTAQFIPKLIGAIIVLWIGWKLIGLLKKTIVRVLTSRNADKSLTSFLTSLVDVLMKVMLIIMAMDIIGIKATSFIAILGAAGLAIGMALQGTLQNFAGGVIILLMKPFKVGEYVECGSYKGYVRDIRIFHTFVQPFNGRTIIIPNSELATKSLINHTREPQIRLDVIVSVAYGTDLQKAKDALYQVINAEPLILKEPKAPLAQVSDLAESSVDFTLWLWVKVEDYWTLWGRIRENIYNKFQEENIEIPFPQIQLHTAND